MSSPPPCGRSDCPIVEPHEIDRRRIRVETVEQGAVRYRVTATRYADSVFTPAGVGTGRFSPLDGRAHSYVAAQRSAALLESVLHEADGPNPRVYRAQLAAATLLTLRFRDPLPLLDLRDDALPRLGLDRSRLTGAPALHYRCTQRLAEHLVGAKHTVGLLWTSRQGVLHAERNPDGLASEVLRHESLDVAVVYAPDHRGRVDIVERSPLVVAGEPVRFTLELANLLRIAVV